MPFKHHASRRHKFAKSKHRVTNWAEYNENLRRRADITVWVDESVMHHWDVARTGKRGRPGKYSDLAITVCLESRIGVSVLNKKTSLGRPTFERIS